MKIITQNINLIYKPNKKLKWSKSHAMLPVSIKIKKNIFRIFFSSRNKNNQSNISFIDYDLVKKKIVYENKNSCFQIGKLGCFDDNGVVASSIIKYNKMLYLYYVGWKPQATTRYSLLTGLAISKNNGKTFKRWSQAPILKNSDKEPYQILTAPCVIKEKKLWRMWYVSGCIWKNKNLPKYDIKYAYSKDGKSWTQTSKICIKLKPNERAIARPSVFKIKNKYYMIYCKENRIKTYSFGLAYSSDGLNWKRNDKQFVFNKSNNNSWDGKMQCYPHVIKFKNNFYMFYNGNDYGKSGFGILELIINL